MSHAIIKCSNCLSVIAQCRCPGPHEIEWRNSCQKCSPNLSLLNYVEQSRYKLSRIIDVEPDLLDLYNLLVWVRGENTTWEDVHNAWSVWRTKTQPNHQSLVPFNELSKKVQAMDKEYADAIKLVAKEFNPCNF